MPQLPLIIASNNSQQRLTTSFVINSLIPAGFNHAGVFVINKTFHLLSFICDASIRLRIYPSLDSQMEDLNRGLDTFPEEDSQLIFEGVTTLVLNTINLAPAVTIYNSNGSKSTHITITNLSDENLTSTTFQFVYLPIES